MMEIGERNAQSVQQMFNDIFNNLVKTLAPNTKNETPFENKSQVQELQSKLEENRVQQEKLIQELKNH